MVEAWYFSYIQSFTFMEISSLDQVDYKSKNYSTEVQCLVPRPQLPTHMKRTTHETVCWWIWFTLYEGHVVYGQKHTDWSSTSLSIIGGFVFMFSLPRQKNLYILEDGSVSVSRKKARLYTLCGLFDRSILYHWALKKILYKLKGYSSQWGIAARN
jgi:hypothetical protein